MEEIENKVSGLSERLDVLDKEERKLTKEIVKCLLEVVKLAEEEKLSLTEADHLFAYFMEEDVLPEKLHDIIFDGASLELPEECKEEEITLPSIKKRLLEFEKSF